MLKEKKEMFDKLQELGVDPEKVLAIIEEHFYLTLNWVYCTLCDFKAKTDKSVIEHFDKAHPEDADSGLWKTTTAPSTKEELERIYKSKH